MIVRRGMFLFTRRGVRQVNALSDRFWEQTFRPTVTLSPTQRVFDRLILINTAGALVLAQKEQMEHQIFCKRWVSRRCWKSWIFNSVITSPQQHGKKSVMPSGWTWRRQISISAWQREGFLVFYVHLFVSFGSCTSLGASSELWSCRMSWSWSVWLYGFKMDCVPCRGRSPNVFSTDCFWQNTAGALTKTPKEQMEPQICFKRWVTRRCWKSWILPPTVRRSPQQRGDNFLMAPGRSCGGQVASHKRSCGVCVAVGNWKAEPKGIHADMIRVKREKRRISDDEEDTALHMFVHCFNCFHFLFKSIWYDYFQVFRFRDEASLLTLKNLCRVPCIQEFPCVH